MEPNMISLNTTRRRLLTLMAGGASVAALRPITPAFAAGEIAWLTWDANAKPQYIVPFEKATGTKVKMSYLTSDDAQFAALKAGARSDYDVVNPSINGVWRYMDGRVIKPLDLSKIPNSKVLDSKVFDQYQFDQEVEVRHTLFGKPGKLKLLGFLSHGRMGRYTEATAIARQTGMPADIAAVRTAHNRVGVSLNLEQQLTEGLGVFVKAGWSQGQFEAFEFTDINKTVALGLSVNGSRWGRPDDTVGVAVAVNDASGAAKQFFAAGGLGILVGDGQLVHSSPEYILETYYNVAVFKFAKLSLDYQFVDHPAYNRDRGPVSIFGFRAHGEF